MHTYVHPFCMNKREALTNRGARLLNILSDTSLLPENLENMSEKKINLILPITSETITFLEILN